MTASDHFPESWAEIRDIAELEDVIGAPNQIVFDKVAAKLGPMHRAWLEHSPLCMIATADTEGNCDVSPRGDPPGFARVLDDSTLALPDRPGNRRADSFRNVLANPRVGLLFLIPGRGDTLRINGRARLVRDAPFLSEMRVRGHVPPLALVVRTEEIYFHCGKSFLRAQCWDPDTWRPDAAPSRARIAKATEWTERSLADLEERYGPSYTKRLYD